MTPIAVLSDYRTEMERLTAENQRLRIDLAEQRGTNVALEDMLRRARKRLEEVYAQKLRLILQGVEHG